jgi:hypothetical protein
MTIDEKDDIARIKHYLQMPSPGYAFLIGGRWGAGKSYLWKKITTDMLPRLGLKDFTMSAAGLKTLEELEQALFVASIKRVPRVVSETTTVISRALLRHIKVDPKDIVLKADVRQGRTVICIDDMERFAGDSNVLFGFVLALVDDARLHVVLIADENHVAEELKNVQERVVGRYMLAPNQVREFFDETYKEINDVWSRAAFERQRDRAIEFFTDKGVVNLRSVRRIVVVLDEILRAMPRIDGRDPNIWNLFTAVSFHVLATAENAGNIGLVRRAFTTSNVSTALMLRRVRAQNEGSSSDGHQEQVQVGDLSALVEQLGFRDDVYLWRASPAFAAYVEGEYLDAAAISEDFGVFASEKVLSDDQILINRLRDYRTEYTAADQERFAVDVNLLLKRIEIGALKATHELWMSNEALFYLCREQLSGISTADFTELFIRIVRNYNPAEIDATSYVPTGQLDPLQMDALAAVDALVERCQAIKRRTAIAETITRIIDVSNDVDDHRHEALFVEADERDIFSRLREAGLPGVYRMTSFVARRIMSKEQLEGELPFARAIVSLIEKSFPDKPSNVADNVIPRRTLESAAFHALADILRMTVIDKFGTG